jgi:hypothetical protein
MHERARESHTLHLAARKLARRTPSACTKPNRLEHGLDTRERGPPVDRVQCERERDVARNVEMRKQMERLKHETHARSAHACARGVIELREIVTVEDNATAIRRVQSRDQIEQRGLARARVAHDRDVLARTKLERHAIQDTPRGRAERFHDVIDAKDGCGIANKCAVASPESR